MDQPTRPLLLWHGGKWRLAPWVIQHFPPHGIYVEPFGGAASVPLRKPRAQAEVWNDMDGTLVNLFRVLRSERADELIAALALTPFAREEFEDAYAVADDPVEEARRLVVRSFMGHGSDSANRAVSSGFRKSTTRHGTIPAGNWTNHPPALRAIVERLRGVVVENAPALDILGRYDHPDALFYLDPPYAPATLSGKARKGGARYHAYAHEMTEADHAVLLDAAVVV